MLSIEMTLLFPLTPSCSVWLWLTGEMRVSSLLPAVSDLLSVTLLIFRCFLVLMPIILARYEIGVRVT